MTSHLQLSTSHCWTLGASYNYHHYSIYSGRCSHRACDLSTSAEDICCPRYQTCLGCGAPWWMFYHLVGPLNEFSTAVVVFNFSVGRLKANGFENINIYVVC